MNLETNDILSVSFNQDQSCIACATETGFRVYNSDPFQLTTTREFSGGGSLGRVEMLHKSNVLAMVGGGRHPRFPPNICVFWNDLDPPKVVAEVKFSSPVKNVKLRPELYCICLEKQVFVYRTPDLHLVTSFDTVTNPRGILALSSREKIVLACLGNQKGHVNLTSFRDKDFEHSSITIAAHDAGVQSLAVSGDGRRLASCSEKGTIIRIFNTSDGQKLEELRRGVDRAEICSICFNFTNQWLVVSSDKGTIHLFAVSRFSDEAKNPTSNLKFLSPILPAYFNSEWSFAQFRIPDIYCICGFGQEPNTLIVVCADASCYKIKFDPNFGGEMVQLEYDRLMEERRQERQSDLDEVSNFDEKNVENERENDKNETSEDLPEKEIL